MSELVCVWIPYDQLKFIMNELSKINSAIYQNINFYMTDFIPLEKCDYRDIKKTIINHINNHETLNDKKIKTSLQLLDLS